MENKTDLIERLRKIANELEQDLKPKFEVGKVYYDPKNKFMVSVNKEVELGFHAGYGFDSCGYWNNSLGIDGKCIPCPPELWKEALTKEAVKRGLVKGVNAYLSTIDSSYSKSVPLFSNNYIVEKNDFTLSGWFIMQNGIWATVIKECSLEEWYKSFINSPLGVAEYIKSTKTELIEILKNLDND